MKTKFLESERLYFSNITSHDSKELESYLNNKDLINRRYLPWKFDQLLLNEEDITSIIKEWSSDKQSKTFGIFFNESDKLIGHSTYNFSWDTHLVYFGLALDPNFWGKGLGKESAALLIDYIFNNHITHNVNTEVSDWNILGIKFAKSMGLRHTGKMRRTGFKNGKFVDTELFDVLRHEWRSK